MIEIQGWPQVKETFEESAVFLKQYRTPRAGGLSNLSQQLFFDDVDFQSPIIVGIATTVGQPVVETVRRLTGLEVYSVVPHIVFNSGKFSLIILINLEVNRCLMALYLELRGCQ